MVTGHQNHPLGALLAVMALSHAGSSSCNLSIPPLAPFLREELHLTHSQVGMWMSFFCIGVVSASVVFGWITDLLGERRALIIGLGIRGIFMIAFAWVHTFLLGGFLLFLSGIEYSGVNPATWWTGWVLTTEPGICWLSPGSRFFSS
jgi:MFS family permease